MVQKHKMGYFSIANQTLRPWVPNLPSLREHAASTHGDDKKHLLLASEFGKNSSFNH